MSLSIAIAVTICFLVSLGLFASIQARQADVADVNKPKVMIISMFDPEAEVWSGIPESDVLAVNVTVPGLSLLYPEVHCTADGDVCQITIGEAEIDAASSVTSLVLSNSFDLTGTYFLIAGVAGVNPEVASTCSVTFAKYAIQVALQYEFSQFDIPINFTHCYIPLGATTLQQYPTSICGTEVFEFSLDLQHIAADFARQATLNNSDDAIAYRANCAASSSYALGAEPPGVYECDVACSDNYYSGTTLSEAFGDFTTLVNNGSGICCTTAQEDNATGEALLRAALKKLLEFSRVTVMRTASDFDRPYPGEVVTTNIFWAEQGAFEPAIDNIYLAGIEIVQGILDELESTSEAGIEPSNYVGDIFDILGGKPDFGPYAYNSSKSIKQM